MISPYNVENHWNIKPKKPLLWSMIIIVNNLKTKTSNLAHVLVFKCLKIKNTFNLMYVYLKG